MLQVDNENYFEIAEALHCYLTLNHRGLFSEEYELLCMSQFKPGSMWSETRCEEENVYYNEINENNFKRLFEELTTYIGAQNDSK